MSCILVAEKVAESFQNLVAHEVVQIILDASPYLEGESEK
jgi:hypothetical protein